MRLGRLPDPAQLIHHLLVDVQPPAGVDDQDVAVLALHLLAGPGGDLDGVGLARLGVDVGLSCLAPSSRAVDRRGALQVAGRQRDVPVLLGEGLASFAQAVVFPGPARPAIRTTVGPLGAKTRSRPAPPISSVARR